MTSAPLEEEKSIWVIFSKQLGPEKILVGFPEEPLYIYREDGEMEIFSTSKGNECHLYVLKKIFKSGDEVLQSREENLENAVVTNRKSGAEKSGPVAELTYWKEGFWHSEKWICTDFHTYFFHTKTASPDLAFYETFTGSFDLVLDRHFVS
ncbi:MAG: hypothetical protein KGJ02_08680 [Verrucomicrobiota bacterium]|nr:hypothetical protein [Verrucomicrobiota bacterium]